MLSKFISCVLCSYISIVIWYFFDTSLSGGNPLSVFKFTRYSQKINESKSIMLIHHTSRFLTALGVAVYLYKIDGDQNKICFFFSSAHQNQNSLCLWGALSLILRWFLLGESPLSEKEKTIQQTNLANVKPNISRNRYV